MEPWLVTILTAIASSSVVAALVNHFSTRNDRLSHAFTELTTAQLNLQKQVNELQAENEKIRAEMAIATLRDDEKTSYIRDLFHWLANMCEVIDHDWLVRNPKPSLPDDIREEITAVSERMSK